MEMRIKEAIRYLGYGRHAVDDGTFALITEVFRELDQIKCAKSVYRIFDLQVKGADQIEIGGWTVTSKNLSKNLTGCDQIVLFGVDAWDGGGQMDPEILSDRYGEGGCRSGMCCCGIGRVL